MLELLMVVAIMMILSAIAIPQIMNTMRSYQLTSAASQVADAVKFARFEAIRRNISVNSCTHTSGTSWVVWTDKICGSSPATDRQFQLTGNVTFLAPANVPTAGSLAAKVGAAALTTLSASSSPQTIAFDPRGAVNFALSSGGATTVYVFYVGPTVLPAQSYRAVVVMPSGATQIWAGSPTGAWFQIG
jgi:Tfp pilus assembly protein FimT